MNRLRMGTRTSPMAVAQSSLVAQAITERTGCQVELVGISTYGDVGPAPLTQLGGTGVFVSGLRASLLAGEIDIAVHSLKDLPTGSCDGITLAAVPARDDPRDVLVARHGAALAELPEEATVGTGSPRRVAQLLMLRPDLLPVPVRGNAETRLAMVSDGRLDAVVLGYAGLSRIGRLDAVSQVFRLEQMLPAPGQGALAVECRADRSDLASFLAGVDDPISRAAVTAERSLLATLEAGCLGPIGAYASGEAVVHLRAVVAAANGAEALRESAVGATEGAESLGRQVAARLLSRGAGRLIARGDPYRGNLTRPQGPGLAVSAGRPASVVPSAQ